MWFKHTVSNFIFFHVISSLLYDMTGLTGRYRVVGRNVNTIKLGEINIQLFLYSFPAQSNMLPDISCSHWLHSNRMTASADFWFHWVNNSALVLINIFLFNIISYDKTVRIGIWSGNVWENMLPKNRATYLDSLNIDESVKKPWKYRHVI